MNPSGIIFFSGILFNEICICNIDSYRSLNDRYNFQTLKYQPDLGMSQYQYSWELGIGIGWVLMVLKVLVLIGIDQYLINFSGHSRLYRVPYIVLIRYWVMLSTALDIIENGYRNWSGIDQYQSIPIPSMPSILTQYQDSIPILNTKYWFWYMPNQIPSLRSRPLLKDTWSENWFSLISHQSIGFQDRTIVDLAFLFYLALKTLLIIKLNFHCSLFDK